MSKIEFKNFSFRYKNLKEPTLENINLEIKDGEKVLITGQSGSGKSTLVHCINGLIPFAYPGEISGQLLIDGCEPCNENIFEISKKVGTILQDQDSQFIGLSVGEDVAFILENNMMPLSEMRKTVLESLGVVDMQDSIDQSPYELSGGQKQRVSLAGVLSSRSKILLFDEPLANLDPASGKSVIHLIDKLHRKSDKTILIVEHRIEDVLEENIDRVVVVAKGKIIFNGQPCDLLTSDVLHKAGLREPLYIEALKHSGIELTQKHKIDNINNCDDTRIKEGVLNWYQVDQVIKKNNVKSDILSLRNVDFSYQKEKKILKDISFNIRKGEIVSILGNNGAGKSTLSGLIAGILKPDNGEIILNGTMINKWSIKKVGENVGYVMQNPNNMIVKHMLRDEVTLGLKDRSRDPKRLSLKGVLNKRGSVKKGFNPFYSLKLHVGLQLRNMSQKNRDRKKVVHARGIENKYLDIIKTCGLYGFRNWPINSLSYGQKRRAAIASILTLDPKIIILDEPTAGQDYRTYTSFMKFIKELAGLGIAILIITHDIHLALEYSTRSIVLSDGCKIADDTPANVLSEKEIIEKANLKETSLGRLASIVGIEDKNDFIQYFIDFEKGQK
jgi:energy-coupling factor transport system ATP-binding protein